MEKTLFCISLFLVFLTSLCYSDDYKYNEYNYNDYDNQRPYDYTDYSQDLNDYYDHNLLAPPNPPPLPPSPPLPPIPMGTITFFFFKLYNMMKYRLFTLESKQIKL